MAFYRDAKSATGLLELLRIVLLLSWIDKIRIQFPGAVGTDTMTEFRLRMVSDIELYLIPVSLVVPDLFTRGTDGQEAAQKFYL